MRDPFAMRFDPVASVEAAMCRRAYSYEFEYKRLARTDHRS
jgi:hypothetical protein